MDTGSPSADRRPWLALYGARPQHAAADFIDMLSMFRATVAASSAADAIHYFGRTLSYQWLDARSDELAVWLAEKARISKGSRVAIILQNVPEFLIATLGAWKLGATPMPLNPMYQERELTQLFLDGLPGAVLCQDDHALTVAAGLNNAGLEDAPILTCSRGATEAPAEAWHAERSGLASRWHRLATALDVTRGKQPSPVSIQNTDTGLLLYTSGTTGSPKGAVLSHGALAFNSRISVDWFSLRTAPRILAIAPLFHITGFQCQLCAAFLSRGALVLNARFESHVVLESMLVHRPTFMIGTITAYIALMNHPAASADHFSSFDTLYAGGGPVPAAVVEQFQSRFGRRIAVAYGMTETCAPTHVTPYEHAAPMDEACGTLSIGIPVADADAMIERSDGTAAAPGEAGELLLRGPMLMDGYLNKPEATAEALQGGWMHTGDVAVMNPQGWFFLIDRKKDVIIASGFKIWPREIEDVLYAHPSVREAAVIGVPDSYRGETIRAYVSLKPGTHANADELVALCRAQLAAYKAPRQIEFLAELPKTATGKIMRAQLRKNAALTATVDARP